VDRGDERVQQVVERTLLDDHTPIHNRLAQRELGIERKLQFRRSIDDTHPQAGGIAMPDRLKRPVRKNHIDPRLDRQPRQHPCNQ